MKNIFTYSTALSKKIGLPLFITLAISPLASAAPEEGSSVEKNKKLTWEFVPNKELPNVLILGDSISIAYTLEVRKALEEKANVFRPTKSGRTENCQGTNNGIKNIDRWIGETKWDVIHFNFGLHDLKHVDSKGNNSSNPEDGQQAPPEKYEEQLSTITEKLVATGAKLIFATTTPIAPETNKPLRKPEYPPQYNEIAKKIMQKHQIAINDLFAFCEPQLSKIQKARNCHFFPEGSKLIAQQVVKAIESKLKAE